MAWEIVKLIICLAIILASCEFFTNAIEWLGKKLNLGEGVVGSIFAAVGTCLPETLVPIIAIISAASSTSSSNVDIGIGAIIGAPFMLSTLAFFLTGLSAFIFWKKRGTGLKMNVNNKILSRDIGFFIVVYIIGIGVSFVPSPVVKYIVGVLLIGWYVFYIFQTVKNDSGHDSEIEDLYFACYFKACASMPLIVLQGVLALAGIVIGAKFFVGTMESTSEMFGISALALSLIITPIATELPEKFNSIIWMSKKKDTLALGNITGAMVFQSCIPVAVGLFGTPWILDIKALMSALMALLSSILVFVWIKVKGSVNPVILLFGGLFYGLFLAYLIMNGFK
ncbi:MAG: sodium:calcium antiporter [Clostridiales bacterium]|nr:sodium:calcium antiporter [Clostridiales bacterium]